MIVVIDTNVIVSSFFSPTGKPAQILDMWNRQEFEVVVSYELLQEYKDASLEVVKTNLSHIAPEEVMLVITELRSHAKVVDIIPSQLDTEIRDPKDVMVLDTALHGQADVVITGDLDLLTIKSVQNIPILQPAAFLKLINSS